jgi:hypothetical protein
LLGYGPEFCWIAMIDLVEIVDLLWATWLVDEGGLVDLLWATWLATSSNDHQHVAG